MAPSTDILIGDPGAAHVLIRPLSRSHPGLFDDRDESWIDCDVLITTGAFTGNVRAGLRPEEFAAFLDAASGLAQTAEGSARLTTLEGQLSLSLIGDGRGDIRVSGEATHEPGIGNRLLFVFEIDRTSLPAVCESLAHVLAAFPVRRELDARG